MQLIVKALLIYVDKDIPYFLELIRAQGKHYPGSGDLPGGKVDAGESLQDAIEREVFEETQMHIDGPWREWFAHEFVFQGALCRETIFYTRVDSKNVIINPQEHSNFAWIPVHELVRSTLHPQLKELLLTRIDTCMNNFKKEV